MQRKKKIVIVVNSGLLNAGVPRVMMDIYERLHTEYQIDFIAVSEGPGYFDSSIIAAGSKIYYIGPKKALTWKTESFFNFFVRSIRLLKVLARNKYDIIHSNSGVLSGDDLFFAWLCGIKKRISHAHGTYNTPSWFVNKCYSKWSRFLLKKFSTERIAVSNIAGQTLFHGQDYKLILNSVDFCIYDKLKRIEHDNINLLQIGYFNNNKNQLFTLKVAKELNGLGRKFHLYFIGFEIESGYENKLHDYVLENELSDLVTFLPHDYDKFQLFPYIDYMLMPSKTEGLPLVVLECQAAGIMCAVSIGVSEDTDMGLLKRFSIEQTKEWTEFLSKKPTIVNYSKNKASQFDRNLFIEKIRSIYNS